MTRIENRMAAYRLGDTIKVSGVQGLFKEAHATWTVTIGRNALLQCNEKTLVCPVEVLENLKVGRLDITGLEEYGK